MRIRIERIAGCNSAAVVLVACVRHRELFTEGGEGEGKEVDHLGAVQVGNAEHAARRDGKGSAVAAGDKDGSGCRDVGCVLMAGFHRCVGRSLCTGAITNAPAQ